MRPITRSRKLALTVDEVLIREHERDYAIEVERNASALQVHVTLCFLQKFMDQARGFEDLDALVLLLLKQGHIVIEVDIAFGVHSSDAKGHLHVLELIVIVAKVQVDRGLLISAVRFRCRGLRIRARSEASVRLMVLLGCCVAHHK